MAVIGYTEAREQSFGSNVHTVTWTALVKGDTGTPFRMPTFADRSVQIDGTFDTGTIVIEGSNDGVTYYTLSDSLGNAISRTTAALKAISEMTVWIRPNVAGTGGTTSLKVTLAARKGG